MRKPEEMPYAIVLKDEKRRVLMDWSPKAGCTIAVKMFFRQMNLLEKALEYDSWIHNYRMFVFFKEHPTQVEDLTNPDYFKFKVVRNPYSRVVSSYLHTMKNNSMHKPIKDVLKKWRANINFSQFVSFLEKIDLSNLSCDPHYGLQKKKFENNKVEFDMIIKLEEFNLRLDELNERSGSCFNIKGLTSDHHIAKQEVIVNKAYNKKFSKIINEVPNYNQFYNAELVERVTALYREDIEAYKYSYSQFQRTL